MNSAVILLAFNRPEATRKVFEMVRRARPPRLFLVADGPRPDRPGERERCAEVRAILQSVDWPCEVRTSFSEENLGCRKNISRGLTWAFKQTEEAVILEDDCVPEQSFFRYCDELLAHYRDDRRVMALCGSNLVSRKPRLDDASYYFSQLFHPGGWATWARAWTLYDDAMSAWPRIRDGGWLSDVLGDVDNVRYWSRMFDLTYAGEIDSWGYRWMYTCMARHGLAIHPRANLVTNIGFGAGATHTFDVNDPVANLPAVEMAFPLHHPEFMIPDREADDLDRWRMEGSLPRRVVVREPTLLFRARRRLAVVVRELRSR